MCWWRTQIKREDADNVDNEWGLDEVGDSVKKCHHSKFNKSIAIIQLEASTRYEIWKPIQ